MDNKDIARILYEIAQILELNEENTFKIRAYQNAARSLEGLGENVDELLATGRLKEVPGIGKAIAEKIEELATTGKLKYHQELKSAYPSTLFDLLRVPNLGPRKIRALYDQLGIKSIEELEAACKEDLLIELRSFGKRSQTKILEGIKAISAKDGRVLLSKAMPIARDLLEYLRRCKDIERVEIAGSVRRWKEIVNDIDFVAASKKPAKVAEYFIRSPFVSTVIATGDTKTSLRLEMLGLQADLRVVKPSEFACALHHFTGSKEHNVAMRGHAKRLGYKINEYGVSKEGSDNAIVFPNEQEFYGFFKMDYVPPEMRENCGEVEAALAHQIPKLLEHSQLQGIFHVHSTWSDGRDTMEDMIRAALERGYKYVGMSDHSKVAGYAHGLDETRLRQQSIELDRLQEKYPDIKILKGSEVDILTDGALDFSDDILARLDFVVASVHSAFQLDEKEQTRRICRALADPHVDILGHATGRILLGRKGYTVNMDEVLKTALKYNKFIEINASPHRLELEWPWIKKAREMGVRFAINPDAHRIRELDNVPYGVGIARKGWATADDVINTSPWDKVKGWFEKNGRKSGSAKS